MNIIESWLLNNWGNLLSLYLFRQSAAICLISIVYHSLISYKNQYYGLLFYFINLLCDSPIPLSISIVFYYFVANIDVRDNRWKTAQQNTGQENFKLVQFKTLIPRIFFLSNIRLNEKVYIPSLYTNIWESSMVCLILTFTLHWSIWGKLICFRTSLFIQ